MVFKNLRSKVCLNMIFLAALMMSLFFVTRVFAEESPDAEELPTFSYEDVSNEDIQAADRAMSEHDTKTDASKIESLPKTSPYQEEIDRYVINNIDMILSFMPVDATLFGDKPRDLNDLYVMKPVTIYVDTDGELELLDNILYYPVVSNGQVICTIGGFVIDGRVSDNVLSWLASDLNSVNYTDCEPYVIIEEHPITERLSVRFVDKEEKRAPDVLIDLSGHCEEGNPEPVAPIKVSDNDRSSLKGFKAVLSDIHSYFWIRDNLRRLKHGLLSRTDIGHSIHNIHSRFQNIFWGMNIRIPSVYPSVLFGYK